MGTLLKKYQILIDSFLKSDNLFFKLEQQIAIKQNFEKVAGKIFAKPCDVRPLFVKVDQQKVVSFISQAADDILSGYVDQGKELYRVRPETFHVSLALLQDLRPGDMANKKMLAERLTNEQVAFLEKLVEPIFREQSKFKLQLHSLCISENGSLFTLFLDRGGFLDLQKKVEKVLTAVPFIPERKYKKNLIHMTVARLLDEVDERTFSEMKEKLKNYSELSEKRLFINVEDIILDHEVRWMHEFFAYGERKIFKLRLCKNKIKKQ